MEINQKNEIEEAPSIVCIGCAKVIPERADFCPDCGAPVGPTAWMDPMKRIYAGGYFNRRFVTGTPRKWAMLAQLILAALLLPFNVFLIREADASPESIYIFALLIISTVFYFKVIKNYIKLYGKKE